MEEKLRKKWLNDEPLSNEEKQFVASSENFRIEKNIMENAERFKISAMKTVAPFSSIENKLKEKDSSKNKTFKLYRTLSGIAAVMLAIFGLFYYFSTNNITTLATANGEQKTIQLPDNSIVDLNADSQIKFNEKSWNTQRSIELKGEAFFDVEKGATFDVTFNGGKVTVLGTEFNVKRRNDFLEVSCYEGLVQVIYENDTIELPKGNAFRIIENKKLQMAAIGEKPSWKKHLSQFQNIPIKFVFEEFERQYELSVKFQNVDTSVLFSGAFAHNNSKNALTAITAPLGLSFKIEGNEALIYAKN